MVRGKGDPAAASGILEPVIGLPRPRADGLPIPWLTPLSPTGPKWLGIDPALQLRSQAEWRCQVCGDRLPQRAWVILDSERRRVVMDSAMHRTCLTISVRWCPHLHGAEIDAIEVDRSDIHADNQPLTRYSAPGPDNEWGSYGDKIRDWTVPAATPLEQKRPCSTPSGPSIDRSGTHTWAVPRADSPAG